MQTLPLLSYIEFTYIYLVQRQTQIVGQPSTQSMTFHPH